ncbi:MAG: hypothetical protein QM301_06645 [Bacteroidota bacterium]|jgi:hypothetical protein|nr:hypothetical protein [Prolixibacteraceae bacterium]MDI9563849.1 hypothetical protein [Bacteroidota bacterium]NLS98493.1 hypothetical protein [Bacteroidales bacterium]HNZ69421.1 hypothetical protein [Prolixibacteraceae bacterium]HOC86564.1 hypothetical protein [Prolixibacteraceae bacterium]
MKRIFILFPLAAVFLFSEISAQEGSEFKPGGKVEVRIFTNFTSSFSDGKNFNNFNVGRAYLGYSYNFSENFSGKITYDVGNTGASKNQFSGFLKFAYLQYKKDNFSIMGGMIPLYHYSLTDAEWGYRYILNPFHSEYGFGTPADLGLGMEYKFASWVNADLILVNGESFKMAESDSTFKAGAGLKLFPVKNLMIRGYFDTMKRDGANQQTTEVLAVYENSRFKLSAAYSFQKDHALVKGNDYSGYTVNGSLYLKNVTLIGRYDLLESVVPDGVLNAWNLGKDGQFFLAGIEFAPVKGVKIAPNYQGWKPADDRKPFVSRVSLHVDIKI